MVKPSELLVDKSLHGLDTDWRDVFYFNDVTYHIGHCNVDTRRGNVVFTTYVCLKGVSAHDGFL